MTDRRIVAATDAPASPDRECRSCGAAYLSAAAALRCCSDRVVCDGGRDVTSSDGTYRIDCPECDWQSRLVNSIEKVISARVDAVLHYVEDHDRRIPENAPFGDEQCPECLDLDGFNESVSCSECGFIPLEVRA